MLNETHHALPRYNLYAFFSSLLEDVLGLKDIPQLDDIFTAWIGLTPEGAPVLIRDRSVQEIYALDLQ